MAPIHDSAREGDLANVRQLVERDRALLDLEDWGKRTPLMLAADMGRLAVVCYLLDKGARINHRDAFGYFALLEAIDSGRVDVVSLLLERGADASILTKEGWTLLMAASRLGDRDVVQLLLRHGAHHGIDYRSESGATALWFAAEHGRDRVVGLLLDAGADPLLAADGEDGLTPREEAMEYDQQGCVELLKAWEVAYRLAQARRIQDAATKILTWPVASKAPSPEQAKGERLAAAADFLKGRVREGEELPVVEVWGPLGSSYQDQEGQKRTLRALVAGHLVHEMKGELAVELWAFM